MKLLVALTLLVAGVSAADAQTAAPRVVSLDGTTTEIVAALGAADRLVGRDDSSSYPAGVERLPSVGYQFALSAEGILSLHPALVIGRAGAKPQTALDQVRAAGVKLVLLPDEPTLADTREKIRLAAHELGADARGAELIAALDADLSTLEARQRGRSGTRRRALLTLAVSPTTTLVCGPHSGPGAMLALAGIDNALPSITGCKPATAEAIAGAAPDTIVALTRTDDAAAAERALAKIGGIAQTPAARAHRIFSFDPLFFAGFGPRAGRAAGTVFAAVYGER